MRRYVGISVNLLGDLLILIFPCKGIDASEPFVVVERATFQRIFEAIGIATLLCNGDTVRNRIMERFN